MKHFFGLTNTLYYFKKKTVKTQVSNCFQIDDGEMDVFEGLDV